MKGNLDISDVRLIIRNLMAFIVIEGKEFVDEEHKKEYVSRYLLVLIKTINLMDDQEEFSLVEDIANDISNYLE